PGAGVAVAESAPAAAVLDQREAGLLEGGEITADGAGGAGLVDLTVECRNRKAAAALEQAQHLPLANDLATAIGSFHGVSSSGARGLSVAENVHLALTGGREGAKPGQSRREPPKSARRAPLPAPHLLLGVRALFE